MCIMMLGNDVSATEELVLNPISPKQVTQAQVLANQTPMQEKLPMSCSGSVMWSGIVSDTQERTVFLAVSCFLKFLRKQYDVRLYPGVHSSSPSSTIVHMKSPAEDPPTEDHRKRQKFSNDDFPVSDVQRIQFASLKRLDFVVNEVNLIDRNEILLWLLVFTIITYCRLEFYHSQNWCKWFIIFIVEDYFEAAWVVLCCVWTLWCHKDHPEVTCIHEPACGRLLQWMTPQ